MRDRNELPLEQRRAVLIYMQRLAVLVMAIIVTLIALYVGVALYVGPALMGG